MEEPKSPKSTRSRKIRKEAGKIKGVQRQKREGAGRLYFNKKILVVGGGLEPASDINFT